MSDVFELWDSDEAWAKYDYSKDNDEVDNDLEDFYDDCFGDDDY